MAEVEVIRSVNDLRGRKYSDFAGQVDAPNLLLCPPDYFDVVDIKNPHMVGQQGKVDRSLAWRQWSTMRETIEKLGRKVFLLQPIPGVEDMVFSANPSFSGLGTDGKKIALLSNMKFSSRNREVPSYAAWYKERGYDQVVSLSNRQWHFEGHGDALWHPKRRLIWGGFGYRTVVDVYGEISSLYDTPVVALKLRNPSFYHLDTCLCPISERTALFYPQAFDAQGVKLIAALFEDLIETSREEAEQGFACNAMAIGNHVLIQSGNKETVRQLRARGLTVVEMDTSEFIKSGGSVFCMKTFVY